ncbi:MAG: ABC transporter substrate-binding protein [Lachnospiraceae bacterium]|nr:ABC transporter substrate-binding protein [Lachnospiraceae bacterium]
MKKNFKRVLAVSLAAALFTASFAGCGSATEGGSSAEIKIGSIHPLTGGMAYEGQALVNAQQLAIDEINEAGGIKSMGGAKLVLVTGDSQGAADTGASEAQRLIEKEGVVALTGAYQSSVVETTSQEAEKAGIPYVVSVGATVSLAERGFETFFRVQPNSEMFGLRAMEMMGQVRKDDWKTCAIIHEDSVMGTSTADYITKYMDQSGLELLGNIAYSASATTLDSEVTSLAGLNPDVLICVGYYSDTSLLFRTVNERDMKFKCVLGVSNGAISDEKFVAEFGDSVENFINCNYSINTNSEKAQALAAKYKEKYGAEIINHAVFAYESIKVIAAGLEAAGSKDGSKLCKALKELVYPNSEMVAAMTGDIVFNEIGENVNASLCLIQIQDGTNKVVFPTEFAESEIRYND